MNEKDLSIFTHLRQNARMSLTKMSKNTGIPVSTIFDRLKLSEKKIIKKHTTLLDFEKLGYNARMHIQIKVDREDKKAMKEFLLKHPAINSVYRISNGYDYMVEAIFRQIIDAEAFMEILEEKFKIKETKNCFIVEDIKREAFMSDPELAKIFLN